MNSQDTHYVRFERGAKRRLSELPSHQDMMRGDVGKPHLPTRRGRGVRWLLGFFALTAAVLAIGLMALASGTWTAPLQRLANDTLMAMVPPDMAITLGDTDVRIDWPAAISVTYSDVNLSRPPGGSSVGQAIEQSGDQTIAQAGRLSVMIDPMSIVRRAPQVSGIEAEQLQLHLTQIAAMMDTGQGGSVFRLSDLGARYDDMFARIRTWAAIHLHRRAAGLQLALQQSTLLFGTADSGRRIQIEQLMAQTGGDGQATITGQLLVDGAPARLDAALSVPAGTAVGAPASFTMVLDGVPFFWRRLSTLFSNVQADHDPVAKRPLVPTRVAIEAQHFGNERIDNYLSVAFTPRDLSLKLAQDDYVPFSGTMRFDYGFGDDIVTMVNDRWRLGRSSFDMTARIRDAGLAVDDPQPGERLVIAPIEFDVIANRGRLSPADSPAQTVNFAAKAQGFYDFGQRLISATDMQIQSDQGNAYAEGQMALGGPAPIAVFAMHLDEMSTTGLQQFWPAPVARGARHWMLNNIAGGRVTQARFDIVEPLRRRDPITGERIAGETDVLLRVEGVRFDTAGDLPPVRDAVAEIRVSDQVTTIALEKGTAFLPSGRSAQATDGILVIDGTVDGGRPQAALSVNLSGEAAAIGELISYHPINAQNFFPLEPQDLSGTVDAYVTLDWILGATPQDRAPLWSVDMELTDGASTAPIEGRQISSADGTINVTPARAIIDLQARLDGVPATIAMTIPLGDKTITAQRDIALTLNDDSRARFAPGIDTILRGRTPVNLAMNDTPMRVEADLTAAELSLPWVGWSKGPGIAARATFDLLTEGASTQLTDFVLTGASFAARGNIEASSAGLVRARFGRLQLNENDDIAVDVRRNGAGYQIEVTGASFDARALLRTLRRSLNQSDGGDAGPPIELSASVDRVTGFGGQAMRDVRVNMRRNANGLTNLSITATGSSGMPLSIALEGQGAQRRVRLEAFDAGEFLRFADLYGQVRGGVLEAFLEGTGGGALGGVIRLTDFLVVNEPRLAQLVSNRSGDTQSLSEAVRRDIDTNQVAFDLAEGNVVFSDQGIDLTEGVMRGPLVGFSLQGRIIDSAGNMRLTGTFMPAYGINSLFAEIPLLGLVLGNGRDRGLIGVTFLLEGAFDKPQVSVNPLSVIAPGVFRSIFEFR